MLLFGVSCSLCCCLTSVAVYVAVWCELQSVLLFGVSCSLCCCLVSVAVCVVVCCRIGSDEDDEGDDNEVASADDPSETAVSRDAEKDRCSNDSDDDTDTTLSRASVNTNGSCSEGVGAEEGTEEGEWVEVEGCVDIPNGMAIDPEDSVTENSCGDDRSIKLVDSKVTADGPVVAALSTEASVVSNPNTTDAPVGKLDNPASIKCMAASGESGTVTPHGTPGSPNIQPVNGNGKVCNCQAAQ